VALKQNEVGRISNNLALVLGLAIGLGLLRHRGRLMVAESCTGGLAGHWITAIAGSSRWFDGGVISYANTVKHGLLGVQSETLQQQGAVSLQTATEMAQGVRSQHRRMLSDPVKHIPEGLFAFSITGIAGPQGGQPAKPVGTVCFAWVGPWGGRAEQRFFSGDRADIQRQAAAWAMAGLFGELCRGRASGA